MSTHTCRRPQVLSLLRWCAPWLACAGVTALWIAALLTASPATAGSRADRFARLYGIDPVDQFIAQRAAAIVEQEEGRDLWVAALDLGLDIAPADHRVAVRARLTVHKRGTSPARLRLLHLPDAGITVEGLSVAVVPGGAVASTLTSSTVVFALPPGRSVVTVTYGATFRPRLPTMLPYVEPDSGTFAGMFAPFPQADPTDAPKGIVEVTLPAGYLVAGPGTPHGVRLIGDRETHLFELRPPVRAFATCVAYIAGKARSRLVGQTEVRLLTPSDLAVDEEAWLEELSSMVRTLTQILGEPDYRVVHFVAVPHMQELQGKGCGNVVLLGGRRVFERPRDRIPLVAPFVVHELSHLYWANRVASDLMWFFFSEALAQYTTHRYMEIAHAGPVEESAASSLGIERLEHLPTAHDVDMYAHVLRAGREVPLAGGPFDETTKNVVYGKGTLMLLFLARQMGPAALDRVLARIVRSMSFKGLLDWPEFYRQLRESRALPESELKEFLDLWLLATGLPRSASAPELVKLIEHFFARNHPDLRSPFDQTTDDGTASGARRPR